MPVEGDLRETDLLDDPVGAGAAPSAPTPAGTTYGRALRTLYLVRGAIALVWVGVMLAIVGGAVDPDPLLTSLLVGYALLDAAAVLWQLRARPDGQHARLSERVNVAVSLAVALALGITASHSIAAATVAWGA